MDIQTLRQILITVGCLSDRMGIWDQGIRDYKLSLTSESNNYSQDITQIFRLITMTTNQNQFTLRNC